MSHDYETFDLVGLSWGLLRTCKIRGIVRIFFLIVGHSSFLMIILLHFLCCLIIHFIIHYSFLPFLQCIPHFFIIQHASASPIYIHAKHAKLHNPNVPKS